MTDDLEPRLRDHLRQRADRVDARRTSPTCTVVWSRASDGGPARWAPPWRSP